MSNQLAFTAAIPEHHVILCKGHSFFSVVEIAGVDTDSLVETDLLHLYESLQQIIHHTFGESWVLWFEERKVKEEHQPKLHYANELLNTIERERRSRFQAITPYYTTTLYLSALFKPSIKSASEAVLHEGSAATKVLHFYKEKIQTFVEQILPLVRTARILSVKEAASFLHEAISEHKQQIGLPSPPVFLDRALVDTPFYNESHDHKLGDDYIGVISLSNPPEETYPQIADTLKTLPFEYRWIHRYTPLETNKAAKALRVALEKHGNTRISFFREIVRAIDPNLVAAEHDTLQNVRAETEEEIEELYQSQFGYGYWRAWFVVKDKERSVLKEKLSRAEKVLRHAGFVVRRENLFLLDEWLATIPGNYTHGLRPTLLNTRCFTNLLPLSKPFEGRPKNQHLKGPALLTGICAGNSKFHYTTHVNGVGHTALYGATGGGKSAAANLFCVSFLRYEGAKVRRIDVGGSATATTFAVGGKHVTLCADDSSYRLRPFLHIDSDLELVRALCWVEDVLLSARRLAPSLELTTTMKADITEALRSLREYEPKKRTIASFHAICPNQTVRRIFYEYVHGTRAQYFDGPLTESQVDEKAHWVTYEIEHLLSLHDPWPIASALFNDIERSMDGSPMLLFIDEARRVLENEYFCARGKNWLTQRRKDNVAVFLATQSLDDFEQSPLRVIMTESCPTKLFLGNRSATTTARPLYEAMNLNSAQIDIIQQVGEQRRFDYYYSSPLGSRLFSLELKDTALSVCGATSREDSKYARSLAKHTANPSEFLERFLLKREHACAA